MEDITQDFPKGSIIREWFGVVNKSDWRIVIRECLSIVQRRMELNKDTIFSANLASTVVYHLIVDLDGFESGLD